MGGSCSASYPRRQRQREPYQNWATLILAQYAGLPFACGIDRPPIPYPRVLRRRITREMYKDMNLYNVYFVSKGTGPRTVQIEAQNSAGVKAQVEARYPGAYNITLNQLPTSAKKKRE